ncbi:MAG: hypothetical protein D3916_17395, partial [Candidatus Electrothrix sp. MAN1_4]|nr:hypothetical protein [Candidatus Electrothrix sp. MAN1_4]
RSWVGWVWVGGEVEKGAILRVNGQEVRPDDAGHFQYMVSLSRGNTVIKAEAVDPAGNISILERKVRLQQDNQLFRLDNPGKILSTTEEVVISGWLLPGAHLQINKTPVQVQGDFTYLLELNQGEHELELEAENRDGRQERLTLQVLVDLSPPEIKIDNVEHTTTDGQITLSGSISEKGTVVTLNEKAVKLSGGKFNETILLQEGSNALQLAAQDLAGNKSFWKKRVLRDSQPPEILQHEVSPRKTKGGEIVQLIARIKDDGIGPARSGLFTVEVNGSVFKGILNRNEKENTIFSGSVFVLPGVAGPVLVREIRVQDLLGNLAEYTYPPSPSL